LKTSSRCALAALCSFILMVACPCSSIVIFILDLLLLYR
jgi:hypothetical protein